MTNLDKAAEAISHVIRESSSPLGILALLIILLGTIAYFLVRDKLTPKNSGPLVILRLAVFLLFFSATCVFAWAVLRTPTLTVASRTPASPRGENKTITPVTDNDKRKSPPPGTTSRPPVAPPPVPADYKYEIELAAKIAGDSDTPGNAAQACEIYAKALHQLNLALTPAERNLLDSHGSECSKGKSAEHVPVLKEIAQQFEARNNNTQTNKGQEQFK